LNHLEKKIMNLDYDNLTLIVDLSGSNLDVLNNLEGIVQLEYPQFNLPQELAPKAYLGMSICGQSAGGIFLHMTDLLTTTTHYS